MKMRMSPKPFFSRYAAILMSITLRNKYKSLTFDMTSTNISQALELDYTSVWLEL